MTIHFNRGHIVSKFGCRLICIDLILLGPDFKDHQIGANYKHDNCSKPKSSVFLNYHIQRQLSTSHVIPHIRDLVPCPGLTSEACVVASTSVPLTPTEILNLVFL